MSKITKIKPDDLRLLNLIYSTLISTCDAHKNLSFEVLLECRDNIYAIIETNDMGGKYIKAVIGCRRTYIDKTNTKDLKYYCMPNSLMYSIEFLHFNSDTTGIELINLIRECLADKNDGFTIYTALCPNAYKDEVILYTAMRKNHFKYDQIDKVKNTITYVREPVCNPKVI